MQKGNIQKNIPNGPKGANTEEKWNLTAQKNS
jgi:hypothetical protein